ncbi:MAG: 16S rRNA (uracil(1498)-N(3))-methyltransferase, partial [Lachnospiraceae bacterium]|nr:16S rRNA (uracil(1498)-N(3))-methyltransferase [Lachnospiraceae bacterium]
MGRSLRMRLGDELVVCNNGIEYNTIIESISDEQVVCKIKSFQTSQTEPNVKLTLFQAMPKSDKLDFIVQKAVELGVSKICTVITSRCVSRPDKKSFEKKKKRLQKIALEAAKQSGRGIIPEISDIITFDECLNLMGEQDLNLICYEKGGIS